MLQSITPGRVDLRQVEDRPFRAEDDLPADETKFFRWAVLRVSKRDLLTSVSLSGHSHLR